MSGLSPARGLTATGSSSVILHATTAMHCAGPAGIGLGEERVCSDLFQAKGFKTTYFRSCSERPVYRPRSGRAIRAKRGCGGLAACVGWYTTGPPRGIQFRHAHASRSAHICRKRTDNLREGPSWPRAAGAPPCGVKPGEVWDQQAQKANRPGPYISGAA